MVCHSRVSGRGRQPVPAGWAAVSLILTLAAATLPAPAAAQAPGTIMDGGGNRRVGDHRRRRARHRGTDQGNLWHRGRQGQQPSI